MYKHSSDRVPTRGVVESLKGMKIDSLYFKTKGHLVEPRHQNVLDPSNQLIDLPLPAIAAFYVAAAIVSILLHHIKRRFPSHISSEHICPGAYQR